MKTNSEFVKSSILSECVFLLISNQTCNLILKITNELNKDQTHHFFKVDYVTLMWIWENRDGIRVKDHTQRTMKL